MPGYALWFSEESSPEGRLRWHQIAFARRHLNPLIAYSGVRALIRHGLAFQTEVLSVPARNTKRRPDPEDFAARG
ncbi:hypothetical protein ASD02_06080 [Ensifer sp. Root1252]|jgi:hypothetical protein|nr:hypothetical protein ASD00_37895 [Ensifer sp. Root31]KQW58566.1 hypothetical protein ASD02_06080 [Ensifer sp. Root1252]KQW62525.1 hypothetical protein ASD03_14185 [Ensifer sp. Root127]KQY78541.1 hypothetical protein ASD52_01380 [Ensifer sp. Root142]KRC67401.1 hypothetical protein ASE32_09540 [Ensifer sp. Root231]KRC98477.1 hypothetical protein ASE47_04730 [Ensifer sp. Root258]OMQ42330.1 hypothetical protein BKP54_24655 [Ensifer sp. 1H6]PSS65465.1 hypothetical protein C6558_08745 [Ensifer 